MLSLFRRPIGPGGRARGVTLVEMLVVVALVVLMMVILVQIFQSATGAMSASRTTQELDVNLRQVDSIIRSDLAGVTARMTPGMNDPKDKRGYFEYGENAFADAQGEDTDDWMAFTTRAPEGQVFSGRQWLAFPANQNIQPTTINSQVAEVIYFLRNGNLYRRVFLVVPERAKTLSRGNAGQINYGTPIFGPPTSYYYYGTTVFGTGTYVSWQGMNDISCHPAPLNGSGNVLPPIPNDLGDLTNRENRAFRPRFINDFVGLTDASGNTSGDGVPDDVNDDDVNDYYPTLYTDGTGTLADYHPNVFVRDGETHRQSPGSYNIYAFPFIYPGMYSKPDPNRVNKALGWTHYLYTANHAPLDLGDNLAIPNPTNQLQTWWGFPTWRETMSGLTSGGAGWTDPIAFLSSTNTTQPNGLIPFSPTTTPVQNLANFLPPVTSLEAGQTGNGAGSSSFIAIPPPNSNRVWEDDLLLTGVRSFDIKAYDQNAPLYNVQNPDRTFASGPFSAGYQDLGYGAAAYLGGLPGMGSGASLLQESPPTTLPALFQTVNGDGTSNPPQGFGHEGRIPPNPNDFRYHPRRLSYISNGTTYPYNIGDDAPGVIRLTRTFDTWSTDYINAPDFDISLNFYPNNSLALYPSFPPPYPSPLRGIQIQIRLVDPRGEKAKPITIRVDFTDKL